MTDYSQHQEQAIILEFFKGKTDGWFLDIGANDGKTGSNTRALAELGWGGVLVEANPRIFQSLLHNCAGNSKLTCVNVPVKATCELVTFFDIYDQCGTCELKHQPKEAIKHSFWMNSTCPGKLALILGGDYDFVSLDIEGSDLEVLEVMGPVLGKTKLLCVEDAIPCAEFDQDYYDRMLAAAVRCGLSRVVARTNNGKGNTLLARAV